MLYSVPIVELLYGCWSLDLFTWQKAIKVLPQVDTYILCLHLHHVDPEYVGGKYEQGKYLLGKVRGPDRCIVGGGLRHLQAV